MPILKKESYGMAVSNCLRNSPLWDSVEEFLAEYQLITDDDMLDKLTNVTIVHRGGGPMPLADYTAYVCTSNMKAPGPSDHRHKFPHLLPRTPFNKWLYGLFFKLALPFNGNITDFTITIYAPLHRPHDRAPAAHAPYAPRRRRARAPGEETMHRAVRD
jgi:hypothetical protein